MPKKELKPHVHEHLRKRNVDPEQVPDGVIDAFNDCTAAELKAMERLGEAMDADSVDVHLRVSMVH